MNKFSNLRTAMRTALLSTTGLCVAGLMVPSTAWAEPDYSHIRDGQVVNVGDYTFGYDVLVEGPVTTLVGHTVALIDDAELTIDDRAVAEFQDLFVGENHSSGAVSVTNGGRLFINADLALPGGGTKYGSVRIDGAGSLLDVGRNLIISGDGGIFDDSTLVISNGAVVNVGSEIILESRASRAVIWIGGTGWAAPEAAGVVNAPSILLNNQSSINLNHSGTFTYSGEIAGEGVVNVMAGHTILTGDSSQFDGYTYASYEAGTLEVNGRLGGALYLGDSHLTGTGVVDFVRLNPALSGTIRPEATTPTIGELDIGVYSTLYVVVDPETGKSGTLRVAGRATIGEGAELHHIGGSNTNFRRSASFVIIDAAGGVDGQFDIVQSEFAFLDVSMDYTATQVIMNLDRNDIRFVDIAETANQRAVANAIEGITDNLDLSDLVIGLNDQNARLGFTQMAGELHASARSAMLLDAANLRRTVISSVGARDENGYGVWGRALTSSTRMEALGENAGLKAETTGFVGGIDKSFGEAIRAGVVVGFEKGELKSNGLGQIDRDTQHLGVYGRGDWGALNVQAGAIASWHELSSRRDLAFGDTAQTLKGDYDATSQQAYVEAAWSVPMAWATVSPYASLAVNTLDVDAVSEKGGVAALEIGDNAQDLTTAGLGIGAERRWSLSNGRAASVSARVGWESYSGDLEAIQTAAFADSAAFDIVGLPMGDEAVVASVNVAVPVGQSGQLGLYWSGAKGSDHIRNSLALSYRLSF
ncbi:autotransporter outer membrane beta-barrel domain-containing protein [uncultured Brevundimonas sp.]|uniref:autotransporter outer membrane beta-barrel domain-containing protein n=1 Tax=uncultured Brevundimonas sp. TaxID=213418 RepID=UPI00261A6226|nr:autotransporter outer membrane beta-barrel domain-containing protein [uncultured Brevundimonas sp.]